MSKKQILVVDDEATVALLMKESLTDLGPGIEVQTVASGEEALRQMDGQMWDLVVTDHRMPGMSGLELIETMKEKAPATLTILITAYGSEEVEKAAQRLNVYHYMTKPFPLGDLKRVIRTALDGGSRDSVALRAPARDREFRPAIKVALGGAGSVGKTALIRRLCTGQFSENRSMTIGVDFHLYDIQTSEITTRLIVWDLGGQDHFAFTRRAFYRGSKAVGLVYDVSLRRSFEQLEIWRSEIREFLPEVSLVIVGNKTDLPRAVSVEEGRALAEQWDAPFFETSCVSGEGVGEFFATLAEKARDALAARHSPWAQAFAAKSES